MELGGWWGRNPVRRSCLEQGRLSLGECLAYHRFDLCDWTRNS